MESPCFSIGGLPTTVTADDNYFAVDDLFNVSSSTPTLDQQPVAVHAPLVQTRSEDALLDNFLATFPFKYDPTAHFPLPSTSSADFTHSATTTPATSYEASPFEPGLYFSPASVSTSPADQFLLETPGTGPAIDYSYAPETTCGGGDYSLFQGSSNSLDLWNGWPGLDGAFAPPNGFVPELGMTVDQQQVNAAPVEQAPAQVVVVEPAVDASKPTRRSSPPRKGQTKAKAKAAPKTKTPTAAAAGKPSSTKAKKASTVSRAIIRKKINEVMKTVTDGTSGSLYVCAICHPTLSAAQRHEAFALVLAAPSIPKSAASASAKQALAMSTRGIQRYDYNIRKHIAHHHYKELGVPAPTTYPCDRCEREFTRSHDRKVHILSVHERKDGFVCEACGEGFRRPGELENHKAEQHAADEDEEDMDVDEDR